MGSYQIWPCHVTQESNEIYIFGKHMTRAIQKYNFIYFGQVFQKLWQYKCNLTTFRHGLLPNMAMSRDSG